MSTVFCPRCEKQVVRRQKCKRCNTTGYIDTTVKGTEGTALMGHYTLAFRRSCPKCKGKGYVEVTDVLKTEMIFVHNQDHDPSFWGCQTCGYRVYTKNSQGVFEKPEVQLPPLTDDQKHDHSAIQSYIKRKFS